MPANIIQHNPKKGKTMKKTTTIIITVIFTMTLAAGVTMAQQRDTRTPQEKAFEFRNGLMHTIEWKFGKLVEAKFKGDKGAFRKNARDLAYLTTMIPEGFELKDSIVQHSRAKKDIWENWDKFLEKAKKTRQAAKQLASADYDFSAFNPKKFGGQNCGGCHRDFKKRKDG